MMGLNNPSLPQLKTVMKTAVVLGDSITAGDAALVNGLWDFGHYPFERSVWEAGLRLLNNGGVPGQKSNEIAARLVSDGLSYSPDIMTIMSGTNDVQVNTFGTVSAAAYMNYIEQMVRGCLNAGVLPVVVVPPAKTGVPDAYMQRFFYYMLADYYGVPLVDMCTATINPSDPIGGYLTAYTIDGTHPNALGTDVMAQALTPVLRNPRDHRRLPYLAIFPESAANQPSNMLINGNFVNYIGPNIAGWQIDASGATVSYEPVVGYPYTGRNFVYTKTTTSTNYMLSANNVASSNGDFAPGDTVRFAARIAMSQMNQTLETQGVLIQIMGYNGTAFSQMASMQTYGSITEERIYQYEFVLPSWVQGIQVQISTNIPGVYRVGNVTLVNVSRYKRLWQPGMQ